MIQAVKMRQSSVICIEKMRGHCLLIEQCIINVYRKKGGTFMAVFSHGPSKGSNRFTDYIVNIFGLFFRRFQDVPSFILVIRMYFEPPGIFIYLFLLNVC